MAFEARALVTEKHRLARLGGRCLGIIGNANHSFGYHVPAASLPGDDYSVIGANQPIADKYASCAIDIGMDWKASREWLRWLIREIRADRIKGIAEVIGSYDGRNVRYWSDGSGWDTNGEAYAGDGHDTWTHIAIYRTDITTDRGILKGWTATGKENEMELDDRIKHSDVTAKVPYWKDEGDKSVAGWMRSAAYQSAMARIEQHAYNSAIVAAMGILAEDTDLTAEDITAAAAEGARIALAEAGITNAE